MGEVIKTDRFPKPKTPKQRLRLRQKFARRDISSVKPRKVSLPLNDGWRRR